MGIFKFNRKLWPIKAHYFLWNAGTAPVTPFLSIYAKQLGFSSVIVGLIYTVLPICGMLAKPIMGAIADYFKCRKKIFLIFEVITAVTFISLLYTPSIEHIAKCNFACDSSESVINTCLGNVDKNERVSSQLQNVPNKTANCQLKCPYSDSIKRTVEKYWRIEANEPEEAESLSFVAHVPLQLSDTLTSNCVYFRVSNITLPNGLIEKTICPERSDQIDVVCDISCDSDYMKNLLPYSALPNDEVLGMYQFWVFLLLMVIAWVGQAVVVSVSDTICFEILGDEPNKYGQQRCFGSLGWGIFSIVTGFIVDATSGSGIKDYTYAFYLGGLMLLFDFLLSCTFKTEQKNFSHNILKDVSKLFVNLRVVVFCLWTIFIGMCTGLIWNFLFWFIEELAGENQDHIKTLEGLTMAIQCLCGELPFFFLSGWIVKKLGHVNCMTLILATMGVRFILYSTLSNPWYILPIEITNGLTFGLFWTCMTSYASIIAPPGTETTMQGVVGAIFEGIGASIGSFVGGYMFEIYSGSMTYRIFGIVSLLLCLLHAGAQYIISRCGQDLNAYQTPSECMDDFLDDQQELKLVR